MPFNHLLFESLLAGVTKAEDRKNECRSSAELERGPGSTVLLFHLDDDATKRRLGLTNKKCCDYLYFFKHKKGTLLIFVELKSTNVQGAMEQILNPFRAIRDKLNQVKPGWLRVVAVIVSSVAAPANGKKIQKLMKDDGLDLYFGQCKGKRSCSINELIKDLM